MSVKVSIGIEQSSTPSEFVLWGKRALDDIIKIMTTSKNVIIDEVDVCLPIVCMLVAVVVSTQEP